MTHDIRERMLQSKSRLIFYSTYRFIKGSDPEKLFEKTVLLPLMDKINQGKILIEQIDVDNEEHFVLIEPLLWDSEYFGKPIYKIFTVLYSHDNYAILTKAMRQWMSNHKKDVLSNFYINIPSEDTYLVQVLCECGFRLTETRLHYVLTTASSSIGKRYPVRIANENDIENLKSVAVKMRNSYDRIHADIAYSSVTADYYLATYIENAVNGFADIVLVPDRKDGPPDGFMTSSNPVSVLGKMVAKLGCSAVYRKTWAVKLLSENINLLQERGADYIHCDTQAPNMAAIRLLAYTGFELAYVTHIFSVLSGNGKRS